MINTYILFLFAAAIAFLLAKVEINIEGEHGWAKNLPTKKIKNSFTKIFWGNMHITEYHLWLLALMQLFLHFPILFGIKWDLSSELQLQSSFLFATALEDFLWFVMNSHFGFKKFTRLYAHWHDSWIGPVPVFHIKLLSISAILLILSRLV